MILANGDLISREYLIMKESNSGNDWKTLMEKAGSFWIHLTADDIRKAEAGRHDLEVVLRKRYGISSTDARSEVNKFISQQTKI